MSEYQQPEIWTEYGVLWESTSFQGAQPIDITHSRWIGDERAFQAAQASFERLRLIHGNSVRLTWRTVTASPWRPATDPATSDGDGPDHTAADRIGTTELGLSTRS